MPRRTYNSKAGRRRPTTPDPEALRYLELYLERQRLARTERNTR